MASLPILPVLWSSEPLLDEFLARAAASEWLTVAAFDGRKERTIGRLPAADPRAMRPAIDAFAAEAIRGRGSGQVRLRALTGRKTNRTLTIDVVLAAEDPPPGAEPVKPDQTVPRATPHCPRCAVTGATLKRLRTEVASARGAEARAAESAKASALSAEYNNSRAEEADARVVALTDEVAGLKMRNGQLASALRAAGVPVPGATVPPRR